MPKLWNETIAAHRDAVREATLDATAALVAERGLTGVTMSEIAKHSGIGRATLYKYFPDIESILAAWHQRHVDEHLRRLAGISEQQAEPGRRLEAVLRAYAVLSRERREESELASHLHRADHAVRAHQHLHQFISALITAAAERGEVRGDVPAGELAAYCLHALGAATEARSNAALDRIVTVTLSGLRPA
ncbi:TetR/AcrR family transcriptional regulator [Actinocrinis puniceicyclus]|uniref:TetR/AcrR family transcriptional regulator n=1 Tax=Actinocrinis puniceicyclus TaxID=977794 RepID=A0A8J7WGT3_9ACTN|nr:TetR/AcrR family transcriptional regulator [Actinocrinis puniceicyclus]MBS2961996.1 TetR/AcrR family transcriptional regulator [Actinocrinis puniceicyclus]